MLEITSLKNGIVIDHIKNGNGIKIFNQLKLQDLDVEVALILNAKSPTRGRKDILKIQDNLDLNLDSVAIIDPDSTINYIKDEKVIEKKKLELPKISEGILQCQNPKCVSTTEREVKSKFILVEADKKMYKCAYCDQIYDVEK